MPATTQGVLAVYDAQGVILALAREAVAAGHLDLRVEPAESVDFHDVCEVTLYVASDAGEAGLERFRRAMAEAEASRGALLVFAPGAGRLQQASWLDAGAWSVLPAGLDAAGLASHLRAALRMVRGARENPARVLTMLREGEERNRAILEAAVDGIITIDEQGVIDSVNPAAARMFGYAPEELAGTSVNRLMPAHIADRHDGFIRHHLKTGENKVIGLGRETTGLRRNGEEFPIYLAVSEIRLRGRVLFTGIVRDITERKRVENVLARLAMAVDQAAEAIVITDSTPIILYANPAFERHTGYRATEVVGQNPRILKSGQHPLDFYHKMWKHLESGQPWQGHVINRRRDGTLIDVQQVISPIFAEDGTIANFVSVWRDVTRERQLEEQVRQAQKMDSIGRLAGGIAHDFNNLLTAIIGLAGLAQEKLPPDHPAASYLQDMVRASRRSSRLTQQLLTFSRKHLNEMRALRLNDVVTEMDHLLRRSIGEDVEMVLDLAADNAWFEGDNGQMGQVLMNLVVNARDAMPGGGVLTLRTERVTLDEAAAGRQLGAKAGDYVLLSVTDTGSGMSREVLQHIFEPFYTTKEAGRGTGLGLATVYGIVQQHGGFIAVDTEPGRGTSFRIHLPAVKAPGAVAAEAPERATPRGKETILLVEDEEIVRRATGEMLQTLGYRVRATASPEEAMAVAERSEALDLLVTDVVMPRVNGVELARRIRGVRPQLKILLISGFSREYTAPEILDSLQLALLMKPFSRDELGRRVREVLDGG